MNKHIKATIVVLFVLVAALLLVTMVALYPVVVASFVGGGADLWVLYLLYMSVLEACE